MLLCRKAHSLGKENALVGPQLALISQAMSLCPFMSQPLRITYTHPTRCVIQVKIVDRER